MLTLLGIPLVGKLCVPILTVAAVMMLIALTLSRWRQYKDAGMEKLQPTDIAASETRLENNATNKMNNGGEQVAAKEKKKKKSCCGTKGSCCKTKKETGEKSSCSSSDEHSDSNDEEVPTLIDVEELGLIAAELRPDLATQSPTKVLRVPGAPVGRVRLRIPDSSRQQAATVDVSA
ncbi:hypothetical protein B566_EDAN017038 [Ephemera danica]|nr:hypothetical protein B566_EDAN017038 [Ephemera danica]